MYDANGHISVIITRSDLPKFAANNREAGSPEENKAIVHGSLAYFGTYSVSETDSVISYHTRAIRTQTGKEPNRNDFSNFRRTNSP